MSFRSNKGFQVGDILRPLPGKTQTNYWRLENIEEAKVVKVLPGGVSYIDVKITKGYSYHKEYGTTRLSPEEYEKRYHCKPGLTDTQLATITVCDDFFELATPKTDSYEIY